jgi:hypothetical protein
LPYPNRRVYRHKRGRRRLLRIGGQLAIAPRLASVYAQEKQPANYPPMAGCRRAVPVSDDDGDDKDVWIFPSPS